MALSLLIDHFDIAVRKPEDVARLKQLILQLAVRGRLVPQDPNDEPAEVLLERIAAARKQLIDSGLIREKSNLSQVAANDKRYALPDGWLWTRLGNLGEIVGGGTPRTNIAEYWADTGIPWLTPADLYGLTEKLIGKGRRFITRAGLENSSARLLPVGSVLFSSRAPIGYVAIAENELATNQGFKSCVPYIMGMNHYLYYFLKSEGKRIDEGASGTTFKEVSGKEVMRIPIPLPPLAEQHRIVARVDELMAQADALAGQLAAAGQRRRRYHTAALAALTGEGENGGRGAGETAAAEIVIPPDDNTRHSSFVIRHFDSLYADPAAVAELKQAILQLAVRGRLVPQDPNDEPAVVLLERIERDRLISSVIDSEYEQACLPSNWILVDFSDITLQITDGEHATPPRIAHRGIPLVTAKNVRDGYLDLTNTDFVSLDIAIKSWQRCKPENNDVLMVCVGATTGRVCLVKNPPQMVLVRSVALLRPDPLKLFPEYFALVIKSDYLQRQIWRSVRVTAQPCLYLGRMKSLIFPLPPLAEQHRIVARVDELFALADAAAGQGAAAEAARERWVGRVTNDE